MAAVFIVVLSFLPCLLWFLYCLVLKHAGIPHLFLFTLAASIAVVFSVAARFALEPVAAYFPPAIVPVFVAFALTAVPEELSKLLAIVPFSRSGTDRSVLPSKTIYARAVCIALAFASLENVFFAFSVPGSLPLRFITAVPLHASLAVFIARWLCDPPQYDRHRCGSRRIPGLFMPVFAILLHTVYALSFELRPPLTSLSALTAAVTLVGAVFLWNTCGDDDE